MTTPATMTFTEACQVLGIARGTGYALLERGEFPVPVERLGRQIKVGRAALDAYVAGLGGGHGSLHPAAPTGSAADAERMRAALAALDASVLALTAAREVLAASIEATAA